MPIPGRLVVGKPVETCQDQPVPRNWQDRPDAAQCQSPTLSYQQNQKLHGSLLHHQLQHISVADVCADVCATAPNTP